MVNWFPIFEDMLTDKDFKSLTVTEKLFYIILISDANLRGGFYKADIEYAVELKLSTDKIRRARRKLQSLGWIEAIPGGLRKGNRKLATSYNSVRWSRADGWSGSFYAQIHRYTFECMLEKVRTKALNHKDVWVYLILSYLQHRNRGGDSTRFFISKSVLIELSGVPGAVVNVKNIYGKYVLNNNVHLFEYISRHNQIDFYDWHTIADPLENDNNRKIYEKTLSGLAEQKGSARYQALLKEQRQKRKRKKRKELERKKVAEESIRIVA